MFVSIAVLASGRGTRLGTEIPKAFVRCGGRSLLARSLERLHRLPVDKQMIVALHPDDRETHFELLRDELPPDLEVKLVDGGETRQASMERAFAVTSPVADLFCVHDAARPFFPLQATLEAFEKAAAVGASLLGVPCPDTLKRVEVNGRVVETVDRSQLWAAHTPQVLRRDVLERALERTRKDGFVGTDDVSLVEHLGEPVVFVRSDRRNMKVTTPEDLLSAELLANELDADPAGSHPLDRLAP
ncbi:MAG: 2-C-methyl-D-erythritol 4-phosphate cytidylyltransferase [Planctomycetota bacterium]